MDQTKKENILLIESDVDFGQQTFDELTKNGYSVHWIKDGTQGLQAIMDNMPHLVLIDVTLSGMDGYDVLNKKQAEPLLAKIPVFLMSSQGMPIDTQRVPKDVVAEFLMAIHSNPTDIAQKVNSHFGHSVESAPSQAAQTPSAEASGKKKILWVEDDKLIGTILAKKLVSSGFELFHANNGEEALRIVEQIIPDIVVLDILLPGMSGFDILQKIRMNENLKKVSVLILSNLSKPSDIEKAKMLGAQKFLVKAAASLDQIVAEIRGMV